MADLGDLRGKTIFDPSEILFYVNKASLVQWEGSRKGCIMQAGF